LETTDGDFGLGDATNYVSVELIGHDINGNAVDLTTITDANGNYSFSGLKAGTYSVYQITHDGLPQVGGYNLINAGNYVGTLGGTNSDNYDPFNLAATDGITNIIVGANQTGSNYNFTMVQDFLG